MGIAGQLCFLRVNVICDDLVSFTFIDVRVEYIYRFV